ncbi:MAG: ornithine cyclodeaminase family protein, partial [Comamonadaceae bacterium]
MLISDAQTTRSLLPFSKLIPTLKKAFLGATHVPLRHTHAIPEDGGLQGGGTSLIMPAWDAEFYGVKVVNIFPSNRAMGLPGLHSSYLLHDVRTGVPLALVDGDEITSRRTAAAAALGASLLSRPDSASLLVIGAGRVGSLVAEAMREVRPITRVAIWDIDCDAATRCVETLRSQGIDAEATADLEASAGRADIVSCATLATSPVVRRDWLRGGTHLDLIGSFTPQMQEAEPSCFADARVWVDTQEALAKSGDLLRAFEAGGLAPSDIAGDLALLCQQGTAGRRTSEERTVFK